MKRDKQFMKVISVFLVLTLLLTFFSKTIYNFNLPTVTVVMPSGGVLVNKIEKNALITYSDVTNIYTNESGKIKEVFVTEGQEVEKGQVLIAFYSDVELIDDLTLKIQKKEQDIELLNMKSDTLQADRQYESKLSRLESQTENEMLKLDRLESEIESLEHGIETIRSGSYHSPQMSEHEHNIKIAENKMHNSQILFDAGGISHSELNEDENNLESLKLKYEQYLQSEIDNKTEQVKSKKEQINALQDVLFGIEQEQDSLILEKENSVKAMSYEINSIHFQVNTAKAELIILKKQLAQAQNSAIASECDGIVVQVKTDKNQFVNKNDLLMQLAGNSKVFDIEITIDEDELEIVSPESKIEVNVKGIQKSFSGKVITSAIEQNGGEVQQSLTIRVADEDYQLAHRNATVILTAESEEYDVIVTNSTLRKDNKGYYILTLKEEDNIFGKNYLAQRVYVDILDSDNALSSISGLTFIEPVIETSTAPIDHGSRVKYEKE